MLDKLQHAATSDLRRLDPVVGGQIKSIADPFRSQRGQIGLFTGPDEDGKTLAARVLGQLLGYDVYRVDLSATMSKYIGETEKNLTGILENAGSSGVILFFDESDALFGKRTEVADANDRYANQEAGYLLQRLESFEGLAILTTNSRNDLDDAFVRRLAWTVDFPTPESSQRRSFWVKLLGWLQGSR